MTIFVTPPRSREDRPLVDPETGETAPLSPVKCTHPCVVDSLPPYCTICWEMLEEGPYGA